MHRGWNQKNIKINNQQNNSYNDFLFVFIYFVKCNALSKLFSNFTSGETMKMNLFQSITNAMEIALESDPTASKLQGGETIKK